MILHHRSDSPSGPPSLPLGFGLQVGLTVLDTVGSVICLLSSGLWAKPRPGVALSPKLLLHGPQSSSTWHMGARSQRAGTLAWLRLGDAVESPQALDATLGESRQSSKTQGDVAPFLQISWLQLTAKIEQLRECLSVCMHVCVCLHMYVCSIWVWVYVQVCFCLYMFGCMYVSVCAQHTCVCVLYHTKSLLGPSALLQYFQKQSSSPLFMCSIFTIWSNLFQTKTGMKGKNFLTSPLFLLLIILILHLLINITRNIFFASNYIWFCTNHFKISHQPALV